MKVKAKKRAVIFDLDGTLVDNRKAIQKSWNAILQALTGNPRTFNLASVESSMGLPMDEIIARLFISRFGEPGRVFGEKALSYEVTYIQEGGANPVRGVGGMLKKLSGKYPLYIVSNCQQGYIEACLSSTGFAPYFQGHVSWGESPRTKAENIRLLVEREGLDEAIYVGDTELDMESAKLAEIPFIHAAYGFGKIDGVEMEAKHPSEIPHLVKEIWEK